MKTSANRICADVVSVLHRYGGVTRAVMSPGTRNVPLLVAFDSHPHIGCEVVVDERSAAFAGLGMADAMHRPVALVCTSGTAPLNYGPALAEAFYRNIPLFAVTADRPAEWIDQDDSQTIHQPGIFANYVKATFDLPVGVYRRYASRLLHDAVSVALTPPCGPVHINVQIADPDGSTAEYERDDDHPVHRRSQSALPADDPAVREVSQLIDEGAKVLLVAGFMPHDNGVDDSLDRLLAHDNVTLLAEPCANIRHRDAVVNIEPTLAELRGDEDARPDAVITIGGALVSGVLKKWLRDLPGVDLYCVKESSRAIDCYGQRYRHVQASAADFVGCLSRQAGRLAQSGYRAVWLAASAAATKRLADYCASAPWSALKAMSMLATLADEDRNLQLSNGMAVRYAAMFDCRRYASVGCNRGVSGIDGSTSTAVGFAAAADRPTIFITGDMSCQYDVGALGLNCIPDDFKIIVLNNGGGGIFKYIRATRDIADGGKWYDRPMNLPLEGLAGAYGFNYFKASSADALSRGLERLMAAPRAMLEIVTDSAVDARILANLNKS